MGRLVLVSNRLPITVHKVGKEFQFEHSIGGLATGLGSFYKTHNSLWIGWPGIDKGFIRGQKDQITSQLAEERCHPVFIPQQDIEDFYDGFCNTTIWPLFHYLSTYAIYRQDWWDAYRRVNEAFAKVVAEVAKPDDVIWIQDYQLMLVPEMVRERLPNAQIGFFLHIPFPSFEVFRSLPWRKEMLGGLLGADLVGFHTYDYQQHFLESVTRLLGFKTSMGEITAVDRVVRAGTFPMGINYEKYSTAVLDPEVVAQKEKYQKIFADRKVILSIDRLDYTKGIPLRLKAFNLFLQQNPQFKEKVIMVCVVVPSRTRVVRYSMLKNEIDELVGSINGEHGTIGWAPIWYLFRSLDFKALISLYSLSDVALITPIRDGMNLIAKEYLATKTDGKGVLILTETAGAADELGEAIILNPNNIQLMAGAIKDSLEFPEDKQVLANRIMQARLQHYTVVRWADHFVETLLAATLKRDDTRTMPLRQEEGNRLIEAYGEAGNRLLLLDYDGTLMPFADNPQDASPTRVQLDLLEGLARDPGNNVVLISGRDRDTLERWFGQLDIEMVAEHGVWIKEKGRGWQVAEGVESDWKVDIRPIMDMWSGRTPGSFVEEKDFSLVWHYRKADEGIGDARAKELTNHLGHIVSDRNMQVLMGNKVVEVKNAGIDKGQAALYWFSKSEWDWILAVGDDWTDEDIFKVMPPMAWSIKVGLNASAARFYVNSTREVLALLASLVQSSPQ